eukprot:TRINITY_DN1798_c1_g1_i1.p1 TRINITY_DN1798_c1_g1~~TRINITY_DN1798_c1_g1_i1.p1  ORF type:complete len:396 (-),score=125.64 TRINITY_DN1798_c1_g1_i1:41-1057(-)
MFGLGDKQLLDLFNFDSNKEPQSFIIFGPSGWGKTYITRIIAENYKISSATNIKFLRLNELKNGIDLRDWFNIELPGSIASFSKNCIYDVCFVVIDDIQLFKDPKEFIITFNNYRNKLTEKKISFFFIFETTAFLQNQFIKQFLIPDTTTIDNFIQKLQNQISEGTKNTNIKEFYYLIDQNSTISSKIRDEIKFDTKSQVHLIDTSKANLNFYNFYNASSSINETWSIKVIEKIFEPIKNNLNLKYISFFGSVSIDAHRQAYQDQIKELWETINGNSGNLSFGPNWYKPFEKDIKNFRIFTKVILPFFTSLFFEIECKESCFLDFDQEQDRWIIKQNN